MTWTQATIQAWWADGTHMRIVDRDGYCGNALCLLETGSSQRIPDWGWSCQR